MQNANVIIPTYNEAESIAGLIDATHALGIEDVWVIDNGDDNTAAIAEEHGATVFKRHYKLTFGESIRDSLHNSLLAGFEYSVIMDAGNTHNPSDIPRLLHHAPSHDIVIGSRFIHPAPFLGFRTIISRAATMLFNDLFHSHFSDVTSGFRCYNLQAVNKHMELSESNMFAVQMELLAIVYHHGANCMEIPIEYKLTNSTFSIKMIPDAIKSLRRLTGEYATDRKRA